MKPTEDYADLGGGIHEVPDDAPPVPELAEVMRPPGRMPSCPMCGRRDLVEEIVSPLGRFYCGPGPNAEGCSTVFDGSDAEWHRHRERRDEAKKKRELEET